MRSGPVVVCDPGVDDLLALFVLTGAGNPPSAVVGTAGNVDLQQAYVNAKGIVRLLGLDCPVAKGASTALLGPYPETGDPFHGTDGLGGVGSALRVEETAESTEPLSLMEGTVLATGCLTVVAAALGGRCAITEIVWMGGAVAVGGNMTATAEFNAWLDPEAADQVLSSGVPLAMVPLDITHQVPLASDDLSKVGAFGRLAALAARACSFLCDRDSLFIPHDAVAAVALLSPELFTWEDRWVRCEVIGGWTRGMTVVDRRPHGATGSVRVAVDVDAEAVRERIFAALRALA
jgi:pyrimidine-specific ribonucleoside hydrolase